MHISNAFRIGLLGSLMVAMPLVGLAQTEATSFIQKRHKVVRQILKRKASTSAQIEKRNGRLNGALGELFDFRELSRHALRDHWDGLEKSQRDEFVSLLSRLVQRSYQRNLKSTLDFSISYRGESPRGDGTLVRTVARSRKNRRAPEVAVDYTVVSKAGSWKVYDVTTDGVSLVRNYRTQFNRIIKRDGWTALLDKMRKKLAERG